MADRDMTTSANPDLRRLSDASDFDVAEGYPDIRGWEVKGADGHKLGKVKDLIVSVSEMRVRYVDVEVDRSLRGTAATDENGHALLPIGAVELDDKNDDVLASGVGSDFASYPRYGGTEITHGYESSLRNRLGAGGAAAGMAATQPGSRDFYEHEQYDDQKAYAKRRPARAASTDETMTLREEELNVGKRQVQAGEVDVRKRVETEHVREQVELAHDEVSVDRRPLSGAEAGNARIGEDEEIRVPVMREEAVVSKQAVAREEIIVRKQARTENKVVEADLKRERLEIEGDRDVSRGATGSTGGASRSLADRAVDAVDDVKDRVDGNPSSRPGPDATDRRF